MQRSVQILTAFVATAGLALASCASTANSASRTAAAPEKVRKERIVSFKTPVLAKLTSYYPDGLVDEYSTFKYDDAKRKLIEKASFDSNRSDPSERVLTEWKGELASAESVYESEGRLKLRREFEYDSAGHLAKERILDPKGLVQSSSSYTYDSAGNKTEWKVQDGKGIVMATTAYLYQTGALARIVLKDGSLKVTGSIVLEYGANGKLAKRSYLAADGSLQSYESYVYSPAGALLALENHRSDASLASSLAYEYGPLGELVKMTEADGSGAVRTTTRYEYSVREDSRTEIYFE